MIEIPREAKRELLTSIRRFFAEHMEEDIGDLKADLVLEFCLKEICPTVYNLAIRDAQAQLQRNVAELDETCYHPEKTFWS